MKLKKLLSIVLSIVLAVTSLSTAASALEKDSSITDYPVILVPGYSGSELDLVNADGSQTTVWHPDFATEIPKVLLKRIVDLGKGLVLTAKGQGEALGKIVGEEAVEMLGVIGCNDDGTSKNNIVIHSPTAQVTNTAYVRENELNPAVIGEPDFMGDIEALIGDEKCFSFQEDWRMSVLDCAARLDAYIQEVKEYTGKDKVNLIAVSHGGEVTATYLSVYGYKMDVDNAVLTVPAAGGAALAYDIMSDNATLDEYTLVYFVQHGMVSESDFRWLVEANELGFLDDVIKGLLPYAHELVDNFTSIWDFIPAEYYEELKTKLLDPEKNADIIAKSDYVHEVIMPNYNEALSKCITDYGMNVTIIAGTGNASVTGLRENADGIITTNDSTGATTAPYGKRFADGYTCAGTTCNNPAHNHLSPSMEVDGSTAYLPENTFYVDELFHGMTFLDSYSRELAATALLTDKITDVYSNPDFPQFHASTNANNTVFARFDNSVEGYVGSADKALVVTNISKEYATKITSVTFAGAEYTANTLGLAELAPGASVTIPITGKLPAVSGQLLQVEINYAQTENKLSPIGSRTLDFTIMNGTPVTYDSENPLVPSDYSIGLSSVIGEKKADGLKTFGLIDLIDFFYNMFFSIMNQLGIGKYIK